MDFQAHTEQLTLPSFHLQVSEEKVSLLFAAVNTIHLGNLGNEIIQSQ